jgi:hypothetical protein
MVATTKDTTMEKTERLFKTAGYSVRDGVLKLRFTNDKNRYRVLERRGHIDIHLFDLPEEMTKERAALWLSSRRGTPVEVRELIRHIVVANHLEADTEQVRPVDSALRRRGRPLGSKNKKAA